MVRPSVKVQSIDRSVATEITKKSKIISPGKKIDRLIFDNAAHRTDFNVAVAKRRKDIPLYGGRRWIAIKVKEEGKKSKIVYVNVNSLSKRLDLKKSEIYKAHKNKTLETLIKDQVATKLSELTEPEVAPSFETPSVKLHSYIDRMKAGLADSWWEFTTGNFTLFSFRFMLGASDEKLQKEGKLRAMAAAREAYKDVPAYKSHVKASDNPKNFRHFEDLPLTGKKEYIQKVAEVDDLYVNGEIPKRGQIDSSTGTTGEPAVWIRSEEELEMTQKLMSFAKRAMFNRDDIAVINTFALGLWATGITIAGSGPNQGLIANVGVVPDYAEKSISLIKKLTNKDPQKPIVLCGYPPNIRKIAQAIKNDPDLKDKDLNLHAIVGGEAMTEEMRDDILSNGFKNVSSSYGASDLDINIGYETATEVAIRRACIDNPELAQELYGGGPPPMIFHYDPLHYYIETVNDELVFTCCRKERASPRIRYNLHDTGKVMMAKDVVSILKKYGVEITPRTNLPFLFVHGREGTVSYGGSKIHFEHLEQAIRTLDLNNEVNRDRFALYKSADDSNLEFWIEATSDEAYDALTSDIENVKNLLVEEVAKSNTDFRKILEGNSNPYPNIKIFKYQESPMSLHAIKNPHRKLQRVVVGNAELDEHLNDFPDSYTAS